MQDCISEVDLLKIKCAEHELDKLRAQAEAAMAKAEKKAAHFQLELQEVWHRYGLRVGIDSVGTDGAITRRVDQEEPK